MSTQEKRAILDEIAKEAGSVAEFHKMMVEVDPEWLNAFRTFIQASYTAQRTLDRKTLELLQVVAHSAMRADLEAIQSHVRLALEAGATPHEIMEANEAVILITGSIAFHRFRQAWAAEVGFQPAQT